MVFSFNDFVHVNKWLFTGGLGSLAIAILHIGVIIGGPEWYRKMGAGEQMAIAAEQGDWQPAAMTSGITLIFFIWAFYALVGSGWMMDKPLPLQRLVLIVVGSIYTLRGLAIVAPLFGYTGHSVTFTLLTSAVSLTFGFLHLYGLSKAH